MPPAPTKKTPTSAALTPSQDAFLAACTREYNEKLKRLNRDWGFKSYKNWAFDQISGVLTLDLKDGSKVQSDAQIIGSYSPSGTSWEWAWNNPHVEKRMKKDVQQVRKFGVKEKLEYLTVGTVPAPDEKFAAYLSSIAVKVIGSDGVFRGSAGQIIVFLSLKNLRKTA